MRYAHINDESFVLISILFRLNDGQVIDVKEIADEFGYNVSSIYRIFRKINYTLDMIDTPYKIVKIAASQYAFRDVS